MQGLWKTNVGGWNEKGNKRKKTNFKHLIKDKYYYFRKLEYSKNEHNISKDVFKVLPQLEEDFSIEVIKNTYDVYNATFRFSDYKRIGFDSYNYKYIFVHTEAYCQEFKYSYMTHWVDLLNETSYDQCHLYQKHEKLYKFTEVEEKKHYPRFRIFEESEKYFLYKKLIPFRSTKIPFYSRKNHRYREAEDSYRCQIKNWLSKIDLNNLENYDDYHNNLYKRQFYFYD